ncbi:hemin ABC transporter substrate-binding protein [Microbacterium protaetiae]|uniref:Hemin ABC transporter substrate-binding protein n=1 Tax=Microbacterium protaetiae TaxID=2509458 RepID=A0A4P6ECA2_9MICO|nr:ABC transporter substrate-binding protein [Microbacterium protaetiae]QAY59855.1 hemin ABC transporter substrate-binding protein [Microbacterium protaetiae]
MKRVRVAALLLAAALLATGCAASPAPSATTTDAASPTSTVASDAVDALSLTGPVEAETIPDMQPVITDAAPQLPATVTDADGTKVTVTTADRVIALDLYGTLTDTVIGLGLQDRLVGRAMSDTQKALADLPVVSRDGIDLNVEAVLDLHPDLVLTNITIGSAASYRQLEAAGVTVMRFAQVPHLDGIADAIAQVGATFGVADAAQQLIDHTTAALDDARSQIAQLKAATTRAPRTVVLYVRGTGGIFFIMGSDYGASDLIEALGLEDAAGTNGITSLKPANAEALVTLDPEIILAMTNGIESAGGVDAFLKRPGVSATTAGQNKRLVTAADSQLLSYGPRTPQNLVALAEAIYTAAS